MKKMYLAVLFTFMLIVMLTSLLYAGEIHDVATNGNIARVRQLLEQGVDVNVRDNNQLTSLHWAVGNGRTDIAKLLIEKGADVNAKDKFQDTPLYINAYGGNIEIAKLLIERGTDVNAIGQFQDTPLHKAASYGKTDIARLLIEKGANINARNEDKDTPLHGASASGRTDAVKLLIEKGADVNAKGQFGYTPLHKAVSYGNTDIAMLLIEKGADRNAKSFDNEAPAVVAEKKGYPRLAALIRNESGLSPRQEFDSLVRNNSDDVASIVRLARSLNPPPAVPQEARDEMMKGAAAFKLAKRPEDFAEAVTHFTKASRLAPWLPEPYFNLALAQEKLAFARGQQFNFEFARYNIGKYLISAYDAKDIQAGKQKIAELDVQKKRYDDFSNEVSLGVDAYKKGSGGYTEAVRRWRRATEIGPDYPTAYIVYSNLGEVAMNQGDLDASYNYYQKSFELMPDPAEIPARSVNMGVVLERRGDRAKACTYYKKACDVGDKVGCGNMRNCP